MALEKTWRWFGANDNITLDDLVQMGVEGVVTALHHIPNGEVWEVDEIMKLKNEIEAKGMRWSVVESLPVTEGIKTMSEDRPRLIENYKQSLRNLGTCGIDTVCYNFMPVLDWARTELEFKVKNGGEAMFFDFPTFVAFDIFVLKRPNAEKDYAPELVEKAKEIAKDITEEEAEKLTYSVIVKTQSFVDGLIGEDAIDPRTMFLQFLDSYKAIGKEQLRNNLKAFLDDVIPTAEEAGVRLAIHPDDPPFQVLGLPRIVSDIDDYKWLMQANTSPNNGITFCTGSLSGSQDNDLIGILNHCLDRTHFMHLRNTQHVNKTSFYESGHLEGSIDMVEIVVTLLKEQKRRKEAGQNDFRMPMRPDHGLKILTDYDNEYNAGYPLVGRLKGLAELDGLMAGIERFL